MRFAVTLIFLASLAAQEPTPVDARGWVNKGVQEYKSSRYQDAVASFQRAVDLDPINAVARLYLATALMSQYVPGAESPENLEIAQKAEAEFRRVLDTDPNNTTALASLAALTFQQSKLADSTSWYEKLIAADPQNKEAYYSLAVIDWQNWYAAYKQARAGLGMRPEQPGPIPDPAVRQRLSQEYSAVIQHGISNLEKALQLDPQYDDAMAYMNLLIRERADLADTPEVYRNEVQTADEWIQKALATKKAKLQAQGIIGAEPSPHPGTPQRIRVGGNVQAENLTHKVDPEYPPLAKQARIQGTVRFTAIISRDGRIQNLQLVSGHPLLIESARTAVQQWEYRPTLLNGSPVEVLTMIDVNFTLSQ